MTTFTFHYGTLPFKRLTFGLCNGPGTLKRCMMLIFYNMVEDTIVVFMEKYSVVGDSLDQYWSHLGKVIKRYEDCSVLLFLEKCHFMVNEDIVFGNRIS